MYSENADYKLSVANGVFQTRKPSENYSSEKDNIVLVGEFLGIDT